MESWALLTKHQDLSHYNLNDSSHIIRLSPCAVRRLLLLQARAIFLWFPILQLTPNDNKQSINLFGTLSLFTNLSTSNMNPTLVKFSFQSDTLFIYSSGVKHTLSSSIIIFGGKSLDNIIIHPRSRSNGQCNPSRQKQASDIGKCKRLSPRHSPFLLARW